MATVMQQGELPGLNEALTALEKKLAEQAFAQRLALDAAEAGQACSMVWGAHRGVETPRVFLLALPLGKWEQANADYVQQLAWSQAPTDLGDEQYPKFGVVTDGEHEAIFDLEYPAHQIDRLPSLAEIGEYKRIKADPTRRWSLQMYDRLMNGFNAFHEQVYHTVKDRVDGKNDIILEVTKLLFLESFRLHHDPKDLVFEHEGRKLQLDEVLTYAYVQAHGKQAVAEIQAAFDHFKTHQDYVVTDDAGESHPIFDRNEHLRLEQPRNYETLLDLIQNLGPVEDNSGRQLKPKGTLADIAGDVLGRAFDVFLRANFDSKGGLGIYLTPAPVKQAMLEIAFHDILEETPELLSARHADGTPVFRFCDPACGSYGFGVVALGYLERALAQLTGRETGPDHARHELFEDMCEHSFVGADSAPMMVTLARVNMALLGAPKAKIFYTQNSLTSDQLQPCSYDLICTNPPFGTPKFKQGQEKARKEHEAGMEKILEQFRTDLHERERSRRWLQLRADGVGTGHGGEAERQGRLAAGETDQHRSSRAVPRPLLAVTQAGRSLADHSARRRAVQQRRQVRPRVHHGQEGRGNRPVPRRQGYRQGGDQPAAGCVQASGDGGEDEHPVSAEASCSGRRRGPVRRRAADGCVHGGRRHVGLRGEEQRRRLQQGRT